MPNPNYKVIIPTNTGQLLELMQNISEKHESDGSSSKLANMEDVDWTALKPRIAKSVDKQKLVNKMRRDAEKLQGEIDKDKEDYTEAARATRDLLLGHYAKNPRTLGDWGYTVNMAGGDTDTSTDESEKTE